MLPYVVLATAVAALTQPASFAWYVAIDLSRNPLITIIRGSC
jgi:hypothetical protein